MAKAARRMDESLRHAELALTAFREAKGRALKLVAEERMSRREALKSMRRLYEKLSDAYLRASKETTYAMWCELVKPEWDELLAAASDDALWDYLVDNYERRAHG